jgi:hypothetical protein
MFPARFREELSRRPRASGLHILDSAPNPLNRLVEIAPLLVQTVRERLIKGSRRVLSMAPGVVDCTWRF